MRTTVYKFEGVIFKRFEDALNFIILGVFLYEF